MFSLVGGREMWRGDQMYFDGYSTCVFYSLGVKGVGVYMVV